MTYQRKEQIGNCTLYLGDCRDVLPGVGRADAVITDPVWPNGQSMFPGIDATKLLQESILSVESLKRLSITLRADSDPRILSAVPEYLPFVCVQWLEYAVPGFVGRTLGGNEVSYGFGDPIRFQRGRQLIPGRGPKAQPGRSGVEHPCPRPIEHVRFLVWWWSDDGERVVDPFMGSGTTGVACAQIGRSFIGIEIDEGYFDTACERIRAAYAQPDMFVEQA